MVLPTAGAALGRFSAQLHAVEAPVAVPVPVPVLRQKSAGRLVTTDLVRKA